MVFESRVLRRTMRRTPNAPAHLDLVFLAKGFAAALACAGPSPSLSSFSVLV